MPIQESSDYLELSGQAYNLVSDAFADSSSRALEYWKSVWQIAARRPCSTTLDTSVRETYDRTNEIVGLTVGELATAGQRSAEFGEKLLAHGIKVQQTYAKATRSVYEAGFSNLTFVKETVDGQLDDLGKRFEQVPGAANPASQN